MISELLFFKQANSLWRRSKPLYLEVKLKVWIICQILHFFVLHSHNVCRTGRTGKISGLGVLTNYSITVSLSANLVATPDKQPKLAPFVVLRICSCLSPSETSYKQCVAPKTYITVSESIVLVLILDFILM